MSECSKSILSSGSGGRILPDGFYFLIGPTAVGKSAVAQYIAEGMYCPVISADSMLVYTGMDIGTAKPSQSDRRKVSYFGIDIVAPDRSFSVWEYIEHIRPVVSGLDRGIVTGGTGLYIKGLLSGLTVLPGANQGLREKWSEIIDDQGIELLQQELRSKYPDIYDRVTDKQNPRRLLRALETAEAASAVTLSGTGSLKAGPGDHVQGSVIVGLRMSMDLLYDRIAARVHAMYEGGLIQEINDLRTKYAAFSHTAGQAIGYAEIMLFLDGRMKLEQAVEKTILRTRHLAKRQMTWFRHQSNVKWIDVTEHMTVPEIADRVIMFWMETGPSVLNV